MNPFAQRMFGFGQQQNPFATGGLLGMGQQNPYAGLLASRNDNSQYEQMALPYAQWAAQQLQKVAPQTPIPQQQWTNPQQQAMAQMWDYQQRQQRNLNSGGNA